MLRVGQIGVAEVIGAAVGEPLVPRAGPNQLERRAGQRRCAGGSFAQPQRWVLRAPGKRFKNCVCFIGSSLVVLGCWCFVCGTNLTSSP